MPPLHPVGLPTLHLLLALHLYRHHPASPCPCLPPQRAPHLQNHLLVAKHTSFWPAYGKPAMPVMTLANWTLDLRTDLYGDQEIVGYIFGGELSPVGTRKNLIVGASVLHVIHDVDPIADEHVF